MANGTISSNQIEILLSDRYLVRVMEDELFITIQVLTCYIYFSLGHTY